MRSLSVIILGVLMLTYIALPTYGQKPVFKYIGKGTLLSKNGGNFYRIAQFKSKSDLVSLIGDLQKLCREEYGCVGFHYKIGTDKGGYLNGALLFDANKVKWPFNTKKYGFEVSWHSETTADCKSDKWCGTGAPSLVSTSVDVGKGWEEWLCWARVNPEEKKGNHETDFNWPKKYRLTTKFQGKGKSLSVVKEGRNYSVQLAPTKESSEQYWRIVKHKDGYHYMETMSLDKYGCSMIVSNNQVKLLVTAENDEKKLWRIEDLNNGYYRLTTKSYGRTKSLDIVNDINDDKLVLAPSARYTGQFWEISGGKQNGDERTYTS